MFTFVIINLNLRYFVSWVSMAVLGQLSKRWMYLDRLSKHWCLSDHWSRIAQSTPTVNDHWSRVVYTILSRHSSRFCVHKYTASFYQLNIQHSEFIELFIKTWMTEQFVSIRQGLFRSLCETLATGGQPIRPHLVCRETLHVRQLLMRFNLWIFIYHITTSIKRAAAPSSSHTNCSSTVPACFKQTKIPLSTYLIRTHIYTEPRIQG